MARVVAIHSSEEGKFRPADIEVPDKLEIIPRLRKLQKENTDLIFKGLFVNEEGIGFCEWEAPNPDIVKGGLESLGIPYDEVVEVLPVLKPVAKPEHKSKTRAGIGFPLWRKKTGAYDPEEENVLVEEPGGDYSEPKREEA